MRSLSTLRIHKSVLLATLVLLAVPATSLAYVDFTPKKDDRCDNDCGNGNDDKNGGKPTGSTNSGGSSSGGNQGGGDNGNTSSGGSSNSGSNSNSGSSSSGSNDYNGSTNSGENSSGSSGSRPNHGSSGSGSSSSSGSNSNSSSGSGSHSSGSSSSESGADSDKDRSTPGSNDVSKKAGIPTSGSDDNESEESTNQEEENTAINDYDVTSEEATNVCAGIQRGRTNTERAVAVLKPASWASDGATQALAYAQDVLAMYDELETALQCGQALVPVPTNEALSESCRHLARAGSSLKNNWPEDFMKAALSDIRESARIGIIRMENDLSCSAVRRGQ